MSSQKSSATSTHAHPHAAPGWAWVNGKITPDTQAHISILDHGFLYGDSVYESIRTWGGKPFLLEAHLRRLSRSAEGVGIPMPATVQTAIDQVLYAGSPADVTDRLLRIIVTRGKGNLGYQADPAQAPGLVVISRPAPLYPTSFFTDGISLAVVSVRRTSRTSLDPALKTSNLLNLRMAYMEARRKGADDAVLLNAEGDVAESSGSNIFVVARGDVLITPPLETGILEGITRDFVLRLAAADGIETRQRRITLKQLREAREVFITSTTRSVMPVAHLDGSSIGAASPGPLTRRLMQRFEEHIGCPLAKGLTFGDADDA